MLTHLSISNFAIVDKLDLDIPTGMTVITGETGAGKSIMLDALSLATGARADTDCVRTGCDRAEILATFDIRNLPQATKWLKERELDSDDECILRRVITREGRGRGYINGTPSPLNHLRELGELLVDIHAQHESQSLLRSETHQRLLDEFTGCGKLTTQVASCWQEWKGLQRQIETLRTSSKEQDARIQLLQYQVEELDHLSLFEGEVEELEQEQKQLANAETSLHTCQQVLDLCSENDNGNILHSLTLCQHLLVDLGLDLPALQETINLLSNAQIQVEEAIGEMNRFVDNFQADPDRLQEINERLSSAYSLARKHFVAAEDLHKKHEELQHELEGLQCSDEKIEELEQLLLTTEQSYFELAGKLSEKRNKGAAKLNKAVTKHIHDLGMPAGRFVVELAAVNAAKCEPRSQGMEEIRFLVSTNPGNPPRPLDKVASGGELSRISLAIQVITAKTSGISTLIFDEVDVGIGGGTAEIVGRLLKELGAQGQVLCVTHQPQVASQGHTHFHVRKKLGKNSTSTQITTLLEEARTQEVARMLGGLEMTEHTLAHAREMISRAEPSPATA
ncbi:DNA repair protein RecN [Parendozoicomonas haliclonae]|uniref:DNA repair protein RecN n=1 Tax=Parendozoicomonas haliclonae TaxID=1960125 RepID=A0A1X7ADD1_9GAMM|nr:DNA repair protein RecN [Parendozoicomonas haliclonae]SMA31531.1 DNA repair protein RecN [Parendozoicomonas haliclonae]